MFDLKKKWTYQVFFIRHMSIKIIVIILFLFSNCKKYKFETLKSYFEIYTHTDCWMYVSVEIWFVRSV